MNESILVKNINTTGYKMLQKKDGYFPALTGVRAVAAWFVFIHHFNFFSLALFGPYIRNFFSEFHVGVTMFFVLSGLLLTLKYYDEGITCGRSFYNFMVRRFARIYPVYFLVISINFIYYSAAGYFSFTALKNGWLYYLATLTFLRGFFSLFNGVFVSQSWSLTVEEMFYLLCPFIFLLIKRNKKALALLPVGLILAGISLVVIFGGKENYGFFHDYRFLFNYTFFGRCVEFFIGITIALLYKCGWKFRSEQPVFTITGLVVSGFCIFLISLQETPGHYGDYSAAGILINNLILPLAGISLFYWGLMTERSFISRTLSSPLFLLLGKSSYCFYLIYLFFFTDIFVHYVSGNPLFLFLYLNGVAILLYKFVEHPVNVFLRNKLLR